ncbi:MAG: potassium channel protein [Desulfobacterales bacterium]|nr:potassium channel protein [Desulfobacteraceae bacterium]MBT4363234.1 potassium channel protein [Desulfobacteraceae bacterium]MBT7084822.1 potassium channel protein [Desulfobacterales bacterium]MBT7697146.1 potassium channel protein [Desulfobacterales bacterium]
MDSFKYLVTSVMLSVAFVGASTAGYMLIEEWSFLDALYMTVTTLTTVGFNEVHKLSRPGQIYTIFIIFLGVGFILYVAGAVVQFMVEGRLRLLLGRKRLENKINRLKNHHIVCGYGRIGQVLCEKLREQSVDLVVIENNPDLIPVMDNDKILYVSGSASDEANLHKALIKKAKVLIAALATDIDNVFLVLTARQLNPDLFILARTSLKESEAKLRAAGANMVESPYDIGAVRMAQRLLRPTVTSFLDTALTKHDKNIQMEEIPVHQSSKLSDVALKDSGIRQMFDLIIIAMKKANGNMLFNPSFETVIEGGDTVIAVGEHGNLVKLENVLNP